MKKRVNHVWHDDWILQNIFDYPSYKLAAKAYGEQFGVDISTPALKNHCRYKLRIEKPRFDNYRHITEEQSEWLKRIYPRVGTKEAQLLWNQRYGDNLSVTCIKQIARRVLGIVVDPEVATSNKLKAAHGYGSKRALRDTGETRVECGRLVMKADDGKWQSAGRCVWEKQRGKIPEGYALIALDGDVFNIDLNNLEIVPWNYLGKLSRNHFFSTDPEITKTGIIWCDLETLLNKQLEEEKK